jgi:hypothetical protein
MRRGIILVLSGVLVFSLAMGQAKWGGLARQIAMGGSSAGQGLVLNPFMWDDPALLLLNPAYQTRYKDYFWSNVGGGTLLGATTADNGYGLQNAGISFAINNQLTVGAVLSYDPSFANQARTFIAGVGALGFPVPFGSIAQRAPRPIPPILNVWEAFASLDLGALDVGFGFMYGNSNSDTTLTSGASSASAEASALVFGFRGGILYDMGGGNALDVSAALRLDKANDKVSMTPAPTAPIDGDYSVSGTEFQLAARARLKVSNRVNFVPFATFGTISGEPKEDRKPTAAATGTPASLKVSLTAFAFGGGMEYQTPTVLIATGLSFFTARAKAEYAQTAVGTTPAAALTGTVSNTSIPVINLGGEWWFLDWLAGRAGYYRTLGKFKLKVESTIGTTSTTFETNLTTPSSFLLFGNYVHDGIVTLGLGFRFGNFSLDATVSEEALRRGFGLIGASDNLNSFGFLNASYNFE